MIYTGTYNLAIDPKNRLSIPAGIRSAMKPENDGSAFYLVPGSRKGTLSLFADKYFETYAAVYHASLDPDEEQDDFENVFYSMATCLDIDKQGRVTMPQHVLDYAGIGKQVTVTGARDHLVIWNRQDFQKFMGKKWDQYPELLRASRSKTRKSRNGTGAE